MARMRIRSIHPELWTDPRFVRCTPQAQVFWIALHNSADDQGVFAWDSFALKMRLLPASTVAAEDLLEELARADLVRRFEAAGEAYGAIRDFGETQRPKDPNAIHPLPEELRAYAGHQVSLEEVLGQLRKRLVEAQGGKCGYCATEVSPYAKKATSCEVVLDVPEERGGVDAPGNKVAACRACARSKGTRTGAEFRAFLCERIGRQAEELRPAPATPRIAVVAGGRAGARKSANGGANSEFAPERRGESGEESPPPTPPRLGTVASAPEGGGGSDPFPRMIGPPAGRLSRGWERALLRPGPNGAEVNGWEWERAKVLVAEACGWQDGARIDWEPLARWLAAGYDLHEDILAEMRRATARMRARGDGPRSLGFFADGMTVRPPRGAPQPPLASMA